ncbi:hypothetical protein D3C75_1042190 [compost metagenome]
MAAILITASTFSTRSNPLLPKKTMIKLTSPNPAAKTHIGIAGNQKREKIARAVS